MPKRYYSARFLRYVQENAGRIPVEDIIKTAAGLYDTQINKTQLYNLCLRRGWSLIEQGLSCSEVARIMGVTHRSVQKFWISGSPPLLETRGQYGRTGMYGHGRWWIECGALYQFIYRHPEAYDWRAIRREPYKTWGRQATEREGLLFIEEAARRLDVPLSTLREWCGKYEIPGVVRQGVGVAYWRFSPEALPHLRELVRQSYRKTPRHLPLRSDGALPFASPLPPILTFNDGYGNIYVYDEWIPSDEGMPLQDVMEYDDERKRASRRARKRTRRALR